MTIYLASVITKTTYMTIYLASVIRDTRIKNYNDQEGKIDNFYALESYFYLRNNREIEKVMQITSNIILDSGAFSFLKQSTETNWDKYIEEYAQFINKYDIELFFELDIDSIVGLVEVERLRTKLEKLTGKKPIPVWHKSRGWKYFVEMCKNYPYVALGGIALREIPLKQFEKLFPKFINKAHEYGTKIHGLGYTPRKNLQKYKFDSVDSTAWTIGSRAGYIDYYNPLTHVVEKIENKDKTKRLKKNETAVHNLKEWIKFQRYALKNM